MNDPKRTYVLRNCDVRPMTEGGVSAEALAFRGGTIVAVGREADVLRAAGPGAEMVDVGGAVVLPGFIDTHHHVIISALYGGLLRLSGAGTATAVLKALRTASEALAPGEWLVATEWDEAKLAEGRPPTLRELDEAVPDRPLFALHYSCHRALANSRALEIAGIGRTTPDPIGGVIERRRDGSASGLLVERAMSPVEAHARRAIVQGDTEGILQRLARHYRDLIGVGITRVIDTAVPRDLLPLYGALADRGDVRVPTHTCPVSQTGYLEEPWDVFEHEATGGAQGPVIRGPVKLVFDGAPACAMCLSWWQAAASLAGVTRDAVRRGSLDPLRAALSIRPRYGTKVRSGITIYPPERASAVVRAATDRGFGLATHAIGNDAVETALDAYAAAPDLHRGGVPRLEHGTFLSQELVRRIADQGVAVAVQPGFLELEPFAAAVHTPGIRVKPLRWLLDAGVKVIGSSDYPVAGFDPLRAIRVACHRRGAFGEPLHPEQALTEEEAVAAYTRVAAEVIGAGAETGTLEPGKRADLVVVSGPLLEESSRVRATVVGGEVYGELRA